METCPFCHAASVGVSRPAGGKAPNEDYEQSFLRFSTENLFLLLGLRIIGLDL
jgi:hypothetical protein